MEIIYELIINKIKQKTWAINNIKMNHLLYFKINHPINFPEPFL